MRRSLVFLILCSCLAAGLCLGEEPRITIAYGEYAQFEIVSPQGVRILIDVHNPGALTKPAAADDILLTTHDHPDHIAPGFTDRFPGKQLRARIGEIEQGDVRIKGIASSHVNSDYFPPENGGNYLFAIETAGLKIVHFGDIGQEKLTPQQLKDVSKADIALAPFFNIVSDMNIENKKGFNLMAQVEPKLIIPTDCDEHTIGYALELWRGSFADRPAIQISRQDLTGKTQIVLMGSTGKRYGEIFDLPRWTSVIAR